MGVGVRIKNSFAVYSYSWTTSISYVPFNFDPIFGLFLAFRGKNGLFFGLDKVKNIMGSTHIAENTYLPCSLYFIILILTWFWGLFYFFGPAGYFSGWGKAHQVLNLQKGASGAYSFKLTTAIWISPGVTSWRRKSSNISLVILDMLLFGFHHQ